MAYTYKIWDAEEEKLLKELSGKMSFRNMVKYFPGRTSSSLQCHALLLNLTSSHIHRLYSKDENFFETPNILNSYYAGILSADGSIQAKWNVVTWEISVIDEDLMKKFVEDTKYTGTYYRSFRKTPSGKGQSELVRLRISSEKWVQDLAKNFNVVPDKTHRLSPPNLNSDLLRYSWLVGYTDGDGCVHLNNRDEFVIRYECCSYEAIKWIKELVEKDFWISTRNLKPNYIKETRGKKSNYYAYTINGIKAIKLLQLLKTIQVPWLKRKWESEQVNRALAVYQEKFPQFFEKDYYFDSEGALVKPHFNDKNSINKQVLV